MNRLSAVACVSSIVAGCLLAACTPPPPVPGGRVADEWKKGYVVHSGDAASLGPLIDNDCRPRPGADADDLRRYAEVRYFVGRHAHLRIVPIDAAARPASGDLVFFDPARCAVAVTP